MITPDMVAEATLNAMMRLMDGDLSDEEKAAMLAMAVTIVAEQVILLRKRGFPLDAALYLKASGIREPLVVEMMTAVINAAS